MLVELLSDTRVCFCMTCACNGLPCVYCAGERFFGALGPGMHDGMRVMFTDVDEGEECFQNMMTYLDNHQVWVKMVRNIDILHDTSRYIPSSLSLVPLPF